MKENIKKLIEENPNISSSEIAKMLEVKEYEVLQNMPLEIAKAVDGKYFDDIIKDVATWGDVLFIKITPSFIIEFKTSISQGTYGRGYYNFDMKNSPLGGHLKVSDIQKIIFITQKFHGLLTRSIQFFDASGEHIFKLFVARDEKQKPLESQVAFFELLKKNIANG